MSQQRRPADYRSLEEVDVITTRRGENQAFVVSGYSPGGSGLAGRPVPGDQKFPFFKDVPDVEGPVFLRDGAVSEDLIVVVTNPLPLATAVSGYDTSPELDVRGIRQVLVFLRYFAAVEMGAGVGVLSLVPQASFLPSPSQESEWMTIGVVNPTLNAPAIEPGYAFRHVFSTELRLDPGYTGDPANPQPYGRGPYELTLAFDVGPYDVFRLRYADVVANLSTLYARAYLMR